MSYSEAAIAREMEATGLRYDQCNRRLNDRRVIARQIEADRSESVRQIVDCWTGAEVLLFDRQVKQLAADIEQYKRSLEKTDARLRRAGV